MTVVYGVTPQGFVLKPLQIIDDEFAEDFRLEFGANIEQDEREPTGQLRGILSDRVSSCWELAEDVYHSFTVDGAQGVSLDNVGAVSGAIRKGETYSTVQVTCAGTVGTAIDAESIFRTADSGERFRVVAGDAIGGGGTVAVLCQAVNPGPVRALAGTITVIETTIAGLTSVTNPLDAITGAAREEDEDFRIRRESELQQAGNAALGAIKTNVSNLDGVTAVSIFENDTAITNGDGLPPKSFEVLVEGGDDQEIADTIRVSKGGGIQAYGTTTTASVDEEGNSFNIGYTRPTSLNIYCGLELEVIADLYPDDGDQQVEDAVLAWAQAQLAAGYDVRPSAVEAIAIGAVTGVLGATAKLSLSPTPTTRVAISVGKRQRARFDSTRTTVLSTPVTP